MVAENPCSYSKPITPIQGSVDVNITKENDRVDTESCFSSESLNKYAKYNEWPAKLPAKRCFLNIKSDSNSVELCMVAHFHRNYHLKRLASAETKKQRETIQRSLRLRPTKHYRTINRYERYFKFPGTIESPMRIDDFDEIEKETNTEIFLYGIYSENDKHDIKVIRRGNNSMVSEKRRIYLCALIRNEDAVNDDINHVVLIKNIQAFIGCFRSPHEHIIKEICGMGGVTLCRKHEAELISILPMEFNSMYDVAMACELASIYRVLGGKDIDESMANYLKTGVVGS